MTKKQFDNIVKNAVNYGNLYRAEINKLEEWCENKYGLNWSDVDCDNIIDSLEFGAGRLNEISFEDFKDEIERNIERSK